MVRSEDLEKWRQRLEAQRFTCAPRNDRFPHVFKYVAAGWCEIEIGAAESTAAHWGLPLEVSEELFELEGVFARTVSLGTLLAYKRHRVASESLAKDVEDLQALEALARD